MRAKGTDRDRARTLALPLWAFLLSWTAASASLASTLSLPGDAGAPPGAATTVPLYIDDATGMLGTDIVIAYDPAVARATGVAKTPLSSSQSLTVNLSSPGTIRISLFGSSPLVGGGVLLNLFFNSVGPLNAGTVLDLVSAVINEGAIPAVLKDGHYCVQALPDEVRNLRLSPASPGSATATLAWDADPAATAYNVYTASLPDLEDLTCFMHGVSSTSVADGGLVPSPDTAIFYLVTSTNCRGEGALGFAEPVSERTNPNPCP
ncbi:MAG: hypothetical protein DMF50_05230 [Acidobacteria bacterium]|nr:MAG: hypothetical protein DMF50_05230 [Acidobacteriota bacterium]